MKFTKMHSIGNDFIVINCFDENPDFDPGRLAELLCDRHFGIGADGIVFISPSEIADFKMSVRNADGSETPMSGGGIFAGAKYFYDSGMTNMNSLTVETLDGVKKVDMSVKDEKVKAASFSPGPAFLRSNGAEISIDANVKNYERDLLIELLTVGSQQVRIVFLNVGVPHAVIFANDIDNVPFASLSPAIESHQRFPERTNVDYVQVIDREHIRLKAWSRGVGESMSVGTGAVAAALASWLLGFVDGDVDVKLTGGRLRVEISEDGKTTLSGPATEVFRGEIKL